MVWQHVIDHMHSPFALLHVDSNVVLPFRILTSGPKIFSIAIMSAFVMGQQVLSHDPDVIPEGLSSILTCSSLAGIA